MAKSYRTHVQPKKAGTTPAAPRLVPKPLAKEEFARRLYAKMQEKGWRQSDLARAADLERNAISIYMRGVSLPSPESLKKLSAALGMTPEELLPNYTESAMDRDNPEIEMRVSPADPKSAWLRINKLVSVSLAVKIMGMLDDADPVK